MSTLWIFGFYFLERIYELRLAKRNRQLLLEMGGREYFPETYPIMVALHSLFFVALIFEAPGQVPFDLTTFVCLLLLAALMAMRYWCIFSLGVYWNTRIMVVPGAKVVRSGPYRFLRHPNYLVVTLEFALLPLLMRAPITLVIFSLANLAVLRQRIRLEETALQEETDYKESFGLETGDE